MTEPRNDPNATERRDRREPPPVPRWVKVLGVIAVVVVVTVVVLLLSGSEHGPGTHAGPAPASATV